MATLSSVAGLLMKRARPRERQEVPSPHPTLSSPLHPTPCWREAPRPHTHARRLFPGAAEEPKDLPVLLSADGKWHPPHRGGGGVQGQPHSLGSWGVAGSPWATGAPGVQCRSVALSTGHAAHKPAAYGTNSCPRGQRLRSGGGRRSVGRGRRTPGPSTSYSPLELTRSEP